MKVFAAFMILVILSLSCSSSNDVLATFNGGSITRGELGLWLESRKISSEKVYKDKYAVSDYLKQLAVEKMTAAQAEKKYFNEEKKYKIIENTLYNNFLSAFFIEQKSSDVTFNEKGADLSIIRIFLKKESKQNKIDEEKEKRTIINQILSELRAGKDFNELAGRYSEDEASSRKGRLGIIPESLIEDSVKNSISSLKDNQYTENPVYIGSSLCLIKLHKRYDLNEKNINSTVADKENADRIVDFFKKQFLDNLRNEILKQRKIVSNIDSISYNNPDSVIFSIDVESFTVGELNVILDLFYSLKYGSSPLEDFSLKEKRLTSEKILIERIFASEAEKNYFNKNEKFRTNWFYLRRAALAGSFKYSVLLKDSIISDKEILEEYTLNKSKKYFKIKKNKKEEVKIFLSYSEAFKIIKSQLSREKLKALKKNWDNKIMKDGNFLIVNKSFLVD